jgi:hypothetical protein
VGGGARDPGGAELLYPRDDDEHDHPGALEKPGTPLEVWGYAAWIFPRHLSEHYGDGIIRGVQGALAGGRPHRPRDPRGMVERFPAFAVAAFNDAPAERRRRAGAGAGRRARAQIRPDRLLDAGVPARWHSHHLEGGRLFEETPGACVRDMPNRTPTPTGTWSLSPRPGVQARVVSGVSRMCGRSPSQTLRA